MDDVDTTDLDQPKENLVEDGTPIISVDDRKSSFKICNIIIDILELPFGNICTFPLYTFIMQF